MTAEEKEICITTGASILALDLEEIGYELYPDDDVKKVYIEGFTLSELFTMLRRAMKQLLHELKSDAWKVLPNLVVDANELLTDPKENTVLLTRQLEFTYYCLHESRPKDLESCVPEIQFFVRYEMQFGFWDRSKAKLHDLNSIALLKAQSDANLLVHNLNHSLAQSNNTRKRLNEIINNFDEYTEQKGKDFSSLERSLEAVSQTLTEVRNSERDAAISNGKIATLLERADKDIDAAREKRIQDRQAFQLLQEQLNQLADSSSQRVKELNGYSTLFDEVIDSAREKERHILDQEEEIMRLVGHAADGRLATSFNERERALSSRVDWWRNASIGVTILALGWAGFIFYFNNPTSDTKGINWLILLANVIRTSPGFLLMFFCQAQYTKERNIQEEYAFKAAVSRTVTSYADMIGTGEVNERVKMLIETIQRLYLPPVLGKPLKPFSIRSKDFAQTAKSMAEAAQSFKTAVTEVLPSIKLDGKSEKS